MIKELVENYAKACNELQEATGVITFPEMLQCQLSRLIKLAEKNNVKLEVEEVLDCKHYDYKISASIEGYKFYAIATEEEFKKHMKGRVA